MQPRLHRNTHIFSLLATTAAPSTSLKHGSANHCSSLPFSCSTKGPISLPIIKGIGLLPGARACSSAAITQQAGNTLTSVGKRCAVESTGSISGTWAPCSCSLTCRNVGTSGSFSEAGGAPPRNVHWPSGRRGCAAVSLLNCRKAGTGPTCLRMMLGFYVSLLTYV